MSKVFTIGEILVEIMASKIGQPFDQPGIWNGPYPSGAPAIFIDQVTRLGVPCGIISCVGNDGFGDIHATIVLRSTFDVSRIRVSYHSLRISSRHSTQSNISHRERRRFIANYTVY